MAKSRPIFSKTGVSVVFVLVFVLLIFLADQFNFFEGHELGFLDLRMHARPAQTAHPDIVLVDVDDESINRIGHWPWPRSYHALLSKVLSSYHPRLVLYDVLFTEASTQPKEDDLLGFSMAEAHNVVTAFFFRSENPFLAFFPIDSIRKAAMALGYVNVFPDVDGKVRRIKAYIEPEGKRHYHTSLAAVLSLIPDPQEREKLLRRIPLEKNRSFWINYPGKFSLFKRIPFYQIIQNKGTNDEELRRLFEDKIVVVGVTATGGGDLKATPFSSAYPGMGIQASAMHTLLTEKFFKRIKGPVSLALLLFLALFATYLTRKNPPIIALATVSVLSVFYLGLNFLIFSFLGWILPVFPVLLVIGGTCVTILLLQFIDIRLEGELLVRELSLAARIQENFLSQESPEVAGFDLGFQCQFAKIVGGDLYDWVILGERKLGICVGDVSGKGVPAALYMARVMSEWRMIAKDHPTTSGLMDALNERLVLLNMQGMFVTFLYLILDLDSHTLLISNAGHEPLYFYCRKNGQSEWIKKGAAPPLGILSNGKYPQETMTMEEGDFVLLISDGVRELLNPRGEELDYPGIEKALQGLGGKTAKEIVKSFFQSMESYSKGHPAHDDRTVLCMKIGKG